MTLYVGNNEIAQKIYSISTGVKLPEQAGNEGKYLTTDGENLSWGTPESQGGDVDLSKVIDYTHVTNCFKYIPQDIKLEARTSKNFTNYKICAGSKFHFPRGLDTDGNYVLEEFILQEDINSMSYLRNMIMFYNGEKLVYYYNNEIYVGQNKPEGEYKLWYNINDNVFYDLINDEIINLSLPLMTCQQKSIDSSNYIITVFNGFGYIGNYMFIKPNVVAIMPNGINEDGTYKNVEYTTSFKLCALSNTYKHLFLKDSDDNYEATSYYESQSSDIFLNDISYTSRYRVVTYRKCTNDMYYFSVSGFAGSSYNGYNITATYIGRYAFENNYIKFMEIPQTFGIITQSDMNDALLNAEEKIDYLENDIKEFKQTIQVVSEIPAEPVIGTLYYVKE